MDRDRVLEKIKKCFALASNKGATSGEAAAALRSAQRMMEMHQISEAEVGLSEYTHESIQVPIQAGKKVPQFLNYLNGIIQASFGVQCTLRREVRVSDASWTVSYWGPKDRVMLAAYAHTVTFRTMMNSWNDHIRDNPWVKGERGSRTSFLMGWLVGVHKTITDFAVTEEEETMTKRAQAAYFGKELETAKVNEQELDGKKLRQGLKAAADFTLSVPVGQEILKLEN